MEILKADTPTLKRLINKKIIFKVKNKTYHIKGTIDEVFKGQVYICGDWFSIKDMYDIILIEEKI